ncbi:hypothetical protein [Candidatus Uabimicrobium amorphum]|uniref:Uncharacterized protein n=1 Tax=Uabimicrobium amorphum TaxID=2596890 RepID=A0A5S9IPS2_UABAM|nr:hypothetical protein [Candidatus Uabimicrobium amorphum]BBM85848.1 hypothetical protein UABAM_04226 [Candidatus Uabimicrobium amorphum]
MQNADDIREFLMKTVVKNNRAGITKILRRVEQKFNITDDEEVKMFVREVVREIRLNNAKKRGRFIGFCTIAVGVLFIVFMSFPLFTSGEFDLLAYAIPVALGMIPISLGTVIVILGRVPGVIDDLTKDLHEGII